MESEDSIASSFSSSILGHSFPIKSLHGSLNQSIHESGLSSAEVENVDILVPKLTLKPLSRLGAIDELKRIIEQEEAKELKQTSLDFNYEKKFTRGIIAKSSTTNLLKQRKQNYPTLTIHSTVQEIQQFIQSIGSPEATLKICPDDELLFTENLLNKEINPEATPRSLLDNLLTSLPSSKEKKIPDPFFLLCEDVLNALAEFETQMQTFSAWKDDFFKQNVTSNMKLTLALLAAKILRAQSDLSQMVLEIVRCVRSYSISWSNKLSAILALEEEHVRQSKAFNIAIRKLEALHSQLERVRASKQVFLWEYITKKLLRRQETMMPTFSTEEVSYSDSYSDSSSYDANEASVTDLPKIHESQNTCSVYTQTEEISIMNCIAPSEPTMTAAQLLKASKKQRLNDLKEFLAQKKQYRTNASAPQMDFSLFSKNEEIEQKFNALLNERFPHLPRTIYHYLASQKHYPLLHYPSEIVHIQTSSNSTTDTPSLPKRSWTSDDVQSLSSPVVLKGLVRSNSSNALSQLAELMPSTLNFASEAEKTRQALEGFTKKIEGQTLSQQFHFDKLISNAPTTSPEIFGQVDVTRSWFSFQDVLELSMLHIQQINQLKDEYESKLLQLRNIKVNFNNKPTLPDIESPRPLSHKKSSSPISFRSKSPSPQVTRALGKKEYIQSPPSLGTLSSPPRHLSPPFKKSIHLPSVPAYVPKHSSFLNLGFLDRMAIMALESRNKKQNISSKLLRKQFEENLTKMVVDKKQMFSRDQVAKIMETILPAVFMPFPKKHTEYLKFPLRPFLRAREKITRAASPKSYNLNEHLIAHPDIRQPLPSTKPNFQ